MNQMLINVATRASLPDRFDCLRETFRGLRLLHSREKNRKDRF
jgi:hypothetical protein